MHDIIDDKAMSMMCVHAIACCGAVFAVSACFDFLEQNGLVAPALLAVGFLAGAAAPLYACYSR